MVGFLDCFFFFHLVAMLVVVAAHHVTATIPTAFAGVMIILDQIPKGKHASPWEASAGG